MASFADSVGLIADPFWNFQICAKTVGIHPDKHVFVHFSQRMATCLFWKKLRVNALTIAEETCQSDQAVIQERINKDTHVLCMLQHL